MAKKSIYQIFTRLYSNACAMRKHNGTMEENGCGKFNQINAAALQSIADMGFTHVWFTGIVRHASTTNYPFITHPANANVVKGRAGSPYAICDYYDVDPDLAENVSDRMQEFCSLVQRTHAAGMKCIIDFVPNHVARNYHSDARPCVADFGQDDNTSAFFAPQNNFYYLGEAFASPVTDKDLPYSEIPARASGNDAFTPCPSINDWYETVKLNYGRNPTDGSLHTSPIPDTWLKMLDILRFWAGKGIDGFRVDMAEMVPVEFWQWAIHQVVAEYPHIFFVAETYCVQQYKNYIEAGFDLLYDKVNFYDVVRDVICGKRWASEITNIWRTTEGLGSKMLYFIENHDEQRIASDFFAGCARKARPAMGLAALMGKGGTMVYFGQELGERGMDSEGFSGCDGRTTIFDYWSLPLVQQFVNEHKYDGGQLSAEASELRQWYKRLLRCAQQTETFASGEFYDLMWVNQHADLQHIYAFMRHSYGERYLIVANFASEARRQCLRIPRDAWNLMGIDSNAAISPTDLLGNAQAETQTCVDKIVSAGLQIIVPENDIIVLRI